MNICVAGYYYYPQLMDDLKSIEDEHSVHIIAHREGDSHGLHKTVIPNVGLEFGCYDYYLKNLWDKESDMLFMHDDIEIYNKKPRETFAVLSKIPYDFSFIFDSESNCISDRYAHGRMFYAKPGILNKMLECKCVCGFLREGEESHNGFWFDDKNNGILHNVGRDKGFDANAGVGHLSEILKRYSSEFGFKVKPTIFKYLLMGYRGNTSIDALIEESYNLIKNPKYDYIRGCFQPDPRGV